MTSPSNGVEQKPAASKTYHLEHAVWPYALVPLVFGLLIAALIYIQGAMLRQALPVQSMQKEVEQLKEAAAQAKNVMDRLDKMQKNLAEQKAQTLPAK